MIESFPYSEKGALDGLSVRPLPPAGTECAECYPAHPKVCEMQLRSSLKSARGFGIGCEAIIGSDLCALAGFRLSLSVRLLQPLQAHFRPLHCGHFFRPLHAFPLPDVLLASSTTHTQFAAQLAHRDARVFDFFCHRQLPLARRFCQSP
jgi:hypothetical protein